MTIVQIIHYSFSGSVKRILDIIIWSMDILIQFNPIVAIQEQII